MKKVIAFAALLSLGCSHLALAQTMDNSTNGSTNAASGTNAMGSMSGNAPMANSPSAAGSASSGSTMGSNSMMAPAGSMANGAASTTPPSTMGGPSTGMAATTTTTAPKIGVVTNTQATAVPSPGSASTVPTISGKAAGNMPLKGANSFTEKQAERRLAKRGYTSVAGLAKDDAGVWRGTATNKSSQSVSVALDYKGRITETK